MNLTNLIEAIPALLSANPVQPGQALGYMVSALFAIAAVCIARSILGGAR